MKKTFLIWLVVLWGLGGLPAHAESNATNSPQWQPYRADVFQRAAQEKKLVYLYLEAVWCHWCHVMSDTTHQDPKVLAYLNQHYLAVKVDHDAAPDLANRYRNWGWPALIILDAKKRDLVKRAGYLSPADFLRLLQATVKDPRPERGDHTVFRAAEQAVLSEKQRDFLLQLHQKNYDNQYGGLPLAQKFIDRDSVEYSLMVGSQGNALEKKRALQTLMAAENLLDPIWGGVYQYSTGGIWTKPHFEKIMRVQSSYMRLYTQAYLYTRDPRWLKNAESIASYLKQFLLSPNGSFYVSQDADVAGIADNRQYFALSDAKRRALGMPRIDQHEYTDATAQAAEAFLHLYAADQKPAYLAIAERALNWIMTARVAQQTEQMLVFHHDANPSLAYYLTDHLAAARAFLAMYRVSGDVVWLTRSQQTTNAIVQYFAHAEAGFQTAQTNAELIQAPPVVEENIYVVRFLNLLFQYTGNKNFRQAAEQGMRYLASNEVIDTRFEEVGILMADQELASAPRHFTVVGAKNDPRAQALWRQTWQIPTTYARIEWWDRAAGRLPHHDVEFPVLDEPAGFACSNNRCSRPATTVARWRTLLITP